MTSRAHEQAARTHEHVAKLAEKHGGNIDAPSHRRAAVKAREDARRARLAAMEARKRIDAPTPP